jgi:uncharacterized protein
VNAYRHQRIRDPLHGLIEFRGTQVEDALWRAIQTRPFQRLRRIKQLGFSEVVYPGATHTRFAHSIGTFHVGRQLVDVIRRFKGEAVEDSTIKLVLAAALLHDVGHGPFSHAFEDVGKRLHLKLADHEFVTDRLIRDSELAQPLRTLGSGFPDDVANIIRRGRPGSMYEAVVSSQFDADRLDYMQRDRLMSGTHHGVIDFAWLLANLEVGSVQQGVDDTILDPIETFVLGRKAVSAAETYVLGLFQLYETVYLHKATRGMEKLFTELLLRVVARSQDGDARSTGLHEDHPLVRFAQAPEDIDRYLDLDDATVWGALPLLEKAQDAIVADLARRLKNRDLYKCCDVRTMLVEVLGASEPPEHVVKERCEKIVERLRAWVEDNPKDRHKLLVDWAERKPYKTFHESKGLLNQILIRSDRGDGLVDLGSRSPVIRAITPLGSWRIYIPRKDAATRRIVDEAVKEAAHES